MIIDIILRLFYYILLGLLAILPSGTLNSNVLNALDKINDYYGYFLKVFPLDAVLNTLMLILATEGIFLLYYFIMWIVHRVR